MSQRCAAGAKRLCDQSILYLTLHLATSYLSVMVVIAILAEVATGVGDNSDTIADGAGADWVSIVDRGRGDGNLGSGAGLGGVSVRAHDDFGVVCSVVCGKRVAEWQSVLLKVDCWFLLWLM